MRSSAGCCAAASSQAATLCAAGCNPMCSRLQPHVQQAATLFAGAAWSVHRVLWMLALRLPAMRRALQAIDQAPGWLRRPFMLHPSPRPNPSPSLNLNSNPISPLHLPVSPHISGWLRRPLRMLRLLRHVPISPCISLYLPISHAGSACSGNGAPSPPPRPPPSPPPTPPVAVAVAVAVATAVAAAVAVAVAVAVVRVHGELARRGIGARMRRREGAGVRRQRGRRRRQRGRRWERP